MTVLSLEQAIERSGGELRLNSEWRRLDGLTLSRSGGERTNALLADAERRRRIADGDPPWELSLSAGIANNPLLRDAERRAKLAAEEWQHRYPG